MNNITTKLVHYLEGEWQISREISGSHTACAKGVAFFTPTIHLNELQYSEDVEIILSEGTILKGYQHYIYRCENELLNVYFADGSRLFHSINTNLNPSVEYTASHYCQPDTYITSYCFGDSHFEIEHRVNGPKKKYISRTMYNKLSSVAKMQGGL